HPRPGRFTVKNHALVATSLMVSLAGCSPPDAPAPEPLGSTSHSITGGGGARDNVDTDNSTQPPQQGPANQDGANDHFTSGNLDKQEDQAQVAQGSGDDGEDDGLDANGGADFGADEDPGPAADDLNNDRFDEGAYADDTGFGYGYGYGY